MAPVPANPVWFITASSNGFGQAIAWDALRRGHRVIATARSSTKLAALRSAGATVFDLDVTSDPATLERTVAAAHAVHGRIDVLVNAAGYLLEGAVEEATPAERQAIWSTNVFGALNVTRAVLPHMRARRAGAVALFGSLGGWRGGPAFADYAATKWACSAYGESLRAELAPLGIAATVIEPGYFRSGFLNPGSARLSTATRIPDYDETAVGQTRAALDKTDNHQLGNVEKGAKVIVDVLSGEGVGEGREIPVRLVLGSDCEQVIREKIAQTEKLLEEWKEVARSTDYAE
ncbi:hypothetical protein BDY21DRAFT_372468 [Lineolata rhizophorae]|uniref:Ketoreductase domain-containing protein n=1 Tax=Lineolata rhizophorae TaxID=578093 RepID=A0A6A6NY09_9PEZI|nr:hypothetical protein BDY21DRAFT_372468 [Lineolata rhizophorae]